MRYLYPRLPASEARTIYADYRDRFEGNSLDGLREMSGIGHPAAVFAATGGQRVPDEKLDDIRRRVRNLAESCGWPDALTETDKATFDAEGSKLLASSMEIVPADAGAAGVWMFLSLVLLPAIPPWRWPTWNERRFLDHPRNTFRNQYWRGYVLGTERQGPLDVLGEDELVSVIERPSLSSNPDVAREIYNVYLSIRDKVGDISTMFLMRDYAKRLRRLTPFECFDGLSTEDLRVLCAEALNHALEAAGSTARATGQISAEPAARQEPAESGDALSAESSNEPHMDIEPLEEEEEEEEEDHREVADDQRQDATAIAEEAPHEKGPTWRQLCSACDPRNEAAEHRGVTPDSLKCVKCHGHLEDRCGICGRLVTRSGCRAQLHVKPGQTFQFATQKQVSRAQTLHFTEAEIAALVRDGKRSTETVHAEGTHQVLEVFSGPGGEISRTKNTRKIILLARH